MRFLKNIGLLLVTGSALANFDYQTELSNRLQEDGIILVRNDSSIPMEISHFQVGKFLFCQKVKREDFNLYPVTKSTFKKGEYTILVFCRDGEFLIQNGYI
jgi:hypothetical protein